MPSYIYLKPQIHIKALFNAALQAYMHLCCKARDKRAYRSASLTLEAAVVFPIFVFSVILAVIPLRIIDINRRMQAVAESCCKEAAQLGYTAYRIKSKPGSIKEETENGFGEGFLSAAGSLTLAAYVEAKAEGALEDRGIVSVSAYKSSFMDDGETVKIVIDYEYKPPFSFFHAGRIKQEIVSVRRAWIGSSGYKTADSKDDMEDPIVYIGRGSVRYHVNPECHYLNNDFRAVSHLEIENMRNASGGKYHRCSRCGAACGDTVYIMPNGSSYHSSMDCSAVIAYVRAVRLSEVEHMGACSYCSGG